jgi:hypothetical protein
MKTPKQVDAAVGHQLAIAVAKISKVNSRLSILKARLKTMQKTQMKARARRRYHNTEEQYLGLVLFDAIRSNDLGGAGDQIREHWVRKKAHVICSHALRRLLDAECSHGEMRVAKNEGLRGGIHLKEM